MTLRELFNYNNCDKGYKHCYELIYEPHFEKVRYEKIRLLEVGFKRGESTRAFLEYFPNAEIWTIDNGFAVHGRVDDERFHYFVEDSRYAISARNVKFDFIIDDGSHVPEDQRLTFINLHRQLKKGGVYFIEDVFEIDDFTFEEMDYRYFQSRRPEKREMFSPRSFRKLIRTIDDLGYKMERKSHRDFRHIDSCILEIVK